jgi:hypothetical protein
MINVKEYHVIRSLSFLEKKNELENMGKKFWVQNCVT